MLTQVSTVRSCRMAVQAVSGVLTQLLWGMHTNTLFHCVILYAQAMWPLAFSGAYKGTAEWENCLSQWVCSLSANWVLGLLCALSFNIIPACRRRRVAGLYIVSRLRVMLVQLIWEGFPWRWREAIHYGWLLLSQEACTHLFLLCLLQGHK